VFLLVALLLGVILLQRAREVSAGDEWQPISPEELKMTSLPEAPGAPAVILYRQVDRDDGRTPHETNYVRIKILTEEGRKYANVEIPFFKESSDAHSVKARSIRPDGSIAHFDGKVMEQPIVKAKGVKYLAKTFNLPDVQAGSIIEYRYTVDFNGGYVYDSKWVLSNELFTRRAKFVLKPSPDFSLRWNWPQGLPSGTNPPKNENGTVHMEAQNIPAFQVEDYMPPENEVKFRVVFIYHEEIPEKDVEKYRAAIEELRDAMRRPPWLLEPVDIWRAYKRLDDDRVTGYPARTLSDIVMLVRYALGGATTLEPLPATIAGRFNLWLGREERAGRTYTEAQRAWLFVIRDFIAVNVGITPEDLMDAPDFAAQGGLLRAHALFGDRLRPLLDELPQVLIA